MGIVVLSRENSRHASGYRLAILQRGASNVSYYFGQIWTDAFYVLIFGLLIYFYLLGM
jgi:hypothetical protein